MFSENELILQVMAQKAIILTFIFAMIYQTDGTPGLYVYLAAGWTKV